MFLKKKKWILLNTSILVIFIFASIYITYPLTFHLGEYTTGLSDELLIAWIHSWVIHALFSGNIFSLFDANIYYPYHNTLAYSDLFFTTALLSFIPTWLVGEPIAANNFTFIFSLAFLGFSIYVICYYLTKDYFASLISGLMVTFSPAVIDKKVHLQILAIGFVPLALLFYIIFLKKKKSRYLVISLVCFLCQVYNSFLPGYFIIISYTIILIFYYFNNKKNIIGIITKKNIVFLLSAIILLLPVVIPYYLVSKEFNYTRDIRESVHLALQPEDLLFTSNDSRLQKPLNSLPFNKTSQNNEFTPGFLGLIFTLCTLFSLYILVKKIKNKDIYVSSFITIALVSLVLSFGPVLHLARKTIHDPFTIPLPYALLYYIVPGFNGFRNSSRWEMLFIIAIAIVIAFVMHSVFKKYSMKKRSIIYSLLILGIIAEFNFPMQFSERVPQRKNFPAIYSWLDTTSLDSKIVEMPVYTWNMQPYVFDDNMREYYSTMHFRKMINGASGFSPYPWQDMVIELLKDFPEDKTIIKLKQLGVNYVIVHKTEYNRLYKNKYIIQKKRILNGNVIIDELSKNHKVHMIRKFNEDYVYQIY